MDAASADVPPAIVCSVEAARSGASLGLRGRIVSQEPASGHYRLEIIKESRSGTSRIAQSGAFATSANEPAFVGSATVDFPRGSRILARLSGEALDQSFTCHFDEKSDE
ncbi:MAG: curli-like amyloid fiber formation chaperone CsgH [Roseiarcus sp.]|jgi:hypothetical protein